MQGERHKAKVEDINLKIDKELGNPNKLHLSLNGENIMDWFKQKYQELKQIARPHIKSLENKGERI